MQLILEKAVRNILPERIVSGGQTGVDRAALDFALDNNIPCAGWCPKGRLAEDGIISNKYPLTETDSEVYAVRTELNARDSDGTLILAPGELEGGTKLTLEMAHKYNKPALVVDLDKGIDRDAFVTWLIKYNIKVLNIAGPRESLRPGQIYSKTALALNCLWGVELTMEANA